MPALQAGGINFRPYDCRPEAGATDYLDRTPALQAGPYSLWGTALWP
jgi:hypothetical protein